MRDRHSGRGGDFYTLKLNSTQIIIIFIALIIVAGLLLLLGALIGRELSKPIPTTVSEGEKGVGTVDEGDLTFFKRLTEGETRRPTGEPASARNEEIKEPPKTTSPTPELEKPLTPQAAPAKTIERGEIREYTIQVGSFQEKRYALDLEGKLKDKGFNVSILPTNIPNKGFFYKVYLKLYKTRTEAEAIMEGLKNEKIITGYFIVNG
ncbi:MAG: SPOR domain-containing protein [bacterium]